MVHDAKNPIRRSRRQMDGPDGCNGGVENHAMPRGAINKSLLWLKPCKQQLNRQSIWLRVQPASGVGLSRRLALRQERIPRTLRAIEHAPRVHSGSDFSGRIKLQPKAPQDVRIDRWGAAVSVRYSPRCADRCQGSPARDICDPVLF